MPFDYGFEIDKSYRGPGLKVRAQKYGTCARDFLAGRESVILTGFDSQAALIDALNAPTLNDRFDLKLKTEKGEERFSRSCMPKVIFETVPN